jgi:endonuclease/exonuclease/phosphatase (EEP) superfamily protein YafD
MTDSWTQIRNKHLMTIAETVRNIDGPSIVMGDLNCTSWSPYFADLLRLSGLRDSRLGFGIQPSWTGNTRFMAIPIDHVLVSHEIDVLDRHTGSKIGSDHLPVLVDLSVPADGG